MKVCLGEIMPFVIRAFQTVERKEIKGLKNGFRFEIKTKT